MMDVVRYEQALKQQFLSSLQLKDSPAQAVLDELSGAVPEIFRKQAKVNDLFLVLLCYNIFINFFIDL